MKSGIVAAFIIGQSAAVSAAEPAWVGPIVNGGIGIGVVLWFMWRDGQDRADRKEEAAKRDEQHKENLAMQQQVRDAFKTHTETLIVGMTALKTIDRGYADLLAQVAQQNKS